MHPQHASRLPLLLASFLLVSPKGSSASALKEYYTSAVLVTPNLSEPAGKSLNEFEKMLEKLRGFYQV